MTLAQTTANVLIQCILPVWRKNGYCPTTIIQGRQIIELVHSGRLSMQNAKKLVALVHDQNLAVPEFAEASRVFYGRA